MSIIKKSLSLLMVLVMLVSACTFTATEASAVTPLGCLVQTEAQWRNYYYGTGNLYNTGCGIFSLVNAVGYLTGKRMSVTSTAQWFHDIGGYNVTGGEGTYRTVVYPKVQAKYGATYGFTVDCGSGNTGYWSTSASTKLKNHLANGGVAVCHVPGHFIALVDYNASTNKFHVYDSAPSTARGTLSGYGNCWLTQANLATGKMKLDWFCLLSATGSPVDEVVWETGQYTMLGNKHLRDVASDTYNTVVTVPAGEVMSVTKIVNKRYGYTQYGDYVGYIYLDEDVKRTAALDSGRVTSFTCADVRYANSDYVASWSDVVGASGYKFKIIQLEGEPDPGNSNEAANATVLYDSTTYITQTLSVTIPAAKMTNGKYLKIAVNTVFPDSSTWTFMYVTPSGIPFTDVNINSWMYDPVLYCYENGLISGTTNNAFDAVGEVNFAMMVTVLHRVADCPAPSDTAVMPYTNVDSSKWYYNALLWCIEKGIIRVNETPVFDEAEMVIRETAMLYMFRLSDCLRKNDKDIDSASLDLFSDSAEVSDKCVPAVQWMVTKGVIHGSDGKILPGATITRAQLASMLQSVDIFLAGVEAVYIPLSKGDVNNDGSINSTDYLALASYVAGNTQIGKVYEECADLNDDGVISSSDYVGIKNKVLGQ